MAGRCAAAQRGRAGGRARRQPHRRPRGDQGVAGQGSRRGQAAHGYPCPAASGVAPARRRRRRLAVRRHGARRGPARAVRDPRDDRATAARARRRATDRGAVREIEAHQRRIEAASAEPIALRAAELDFHAAVVDAAQNSLLSHVGAMIRVALEAAASRTAPIRRRERRAPRRRWQRRSAPATPMRREGDALARRAGVGSDRPGRGPSEPVIWYGSGPDRQRRPRTRSTTS